MKLSGFINICEERERKPHRAAAMGLKYKGFGYWVDPNSGKVTHKTEGDNLVPVEPDVETDKWKGDGDESAPGMGGSKPENQGRYTGPTRTGCQGQCLNLARSKHPRGCCGNWC